MKQLAWYSVKNKSHESTGLLSCGFSFYTHNLVRHLLSFSSGWNGPQKIIPCLAPWPLDFKTPMMGTPLRPWDIDCFHCKKFLSYIKMKPLWVQLVPFACCPLSVCPCEERAFMLFMAAFWELENYDGILLSLFFSRVKRANPSGPSPQNGSPALWSPLWSSFEPSPMSVCLFWMVHTRTGHSTAGVAWQVLTRLGWSQLSLCQFCWMQPRIQSAFLAAAAHSGLMLSCPPGFPGPFQQGFSSDRWILACPGNFGYATPEAQPCTYLC